MDNKKENILREFCHLSESDLMMKIHDEVREFAILTKSEKEATRILEKYGKQACFGFNDWKKTRYYKLMAVAKLINLFIPDEWYAVEITDGDVIKRIIEYRNDEIKLIDEYFYIYDGCFVDDENSNDFSYLPSDLEIDKVMKFYNDIIEKEFGNGKKLVK